MGQIKKEGDKIIYRQDDGEITARFIDFSEKTELRHEGSSFYKKVFYLIVALAVAYLGSIFIIYQ